MPATDIAPRPICATLVCVKSCPLNVHRLSLFPIFVVSRYKQKEETNYMRLLPAVCMLSSFPIVPLFNY